MFNRKLLKKYMEDNHLSGAELAKQVGCSQQFVSFILLGTKQPSLGLFKRICEVTGYSMDELMEGE